MNLQTKFIGLMALLVVAVGANLVVALWAIDFTKRELEWPLDSMRRVLGVMNTIETELGAQGTAIGLLGGKQEGSRLTAFPDPDRQRAFEDASVNIASALESLREIDTFRLRSGVSTTLTLERRTARIEELGRRWFDADPTVSGELGEQLVQAHLLVERIEGQIIDDAAKAVGFGQEIRRDVIIILATSALTTLVVVLLGILFVRRWVLRPVSELRVAVQTFARGELDHRVPVRGRDELGLLSERFNHMAGELDQMHRERLERERLAAVGEMSRRIVHNLRSPLSGIRSLAETTRSELSAESDLREVQDRIIATVDRFEVWLRRLLRASSPLELDIAPSDPGAWVREVTEAQRAAAEAAGVTLEVESDTPRAASFDRHHLEHALIAVVSNAIEVTPRGGRVLVRGFWDRADNRWGVRVSDGGPGVPAEHAERVFHPYFTTKESGTGIGLALAQRIVRQHGGEVRLESGPGRPQGRTGAEFVIEIPLDPGPGSANTGHGASANGQDPGHRG